MRITRNPSAINLFTLLEDLCGSWHTHHGAAERHYEDCREIRQVPVRLETSRDTGETSQCVKVFDVAYKLSDYIPSAVVNDIDDVLRALVTDPGYRGGWADHHDFTRKYFISFEPHIICCPDVRLIPRVPVRA